MSDREAIKYLEALRKLSVKLGAEEMGTKDLELIDHCINAVQEREERSKAEKTNGDHIRNMTDEELAVEFMIFRPSDKCFDVDDKNRNYISLNNQYFYHSQDCLKENLHWLNQPLKGEDHA